MVVYHLQGETGWSTVCANGKQNLLNGKIRSRSDAPFAK